MSNRIKRLLTIASHVPNRPHRLTAKDIKNKLEVSGINISLRTVQRDLVMMSSIGMLNMTADSRCKPHGWYLDDDKVDNGESPICKNKGLKCS